MNITWDANQYATNFSFVHQYGKGVLELLDVMPGSTVIDLGCGNGALSAALRERGYRVLGIDASPEQLAVAERSCPGVLFVQADATAFGVETPVDAVFSNAVFHWIDREQQPQMLACVARALRPGGQFVFEMGGSRNNRLIHEALRQAFAAHGYAYRMPFYFPTIGAYAPLLERAGFEVQYATLFDRPTELQGADGLRDWIHMFVKTPFEAVPDEAVREQLVTEAVEALRDTLCREGVWYSDYVRLRMKAVRL